MLWALANWKLLLTGATIALLGLLLVLAKGEARHWKKQDAADVAAYQLETAKNAVQRASISELERTIQDQNAAVDRLAKDSAGRLQQSADALAVAQQGRASAQEAVQRLRASAGANAPSASCKPSATFERVKGGL